MFTNNPSLDALWSQLETLGDQYARADIKRLFAADPERAQRMSVTACDLHLDFSKNLLGENALSKLVQLTEHLRLAARTAAMFAGETINVTEERAVLHTALRGSTAPALALHGTSIRAEVERGLHAMATCVDALETQRWRGFGGDPISDVVNIGIGGSHLGPQLACEALRYEHSGSLRIHFVSNVDGGALERVLRPLDPGKTLFIVASKSFTTSETLLNARSARAWLRAGAGTEEAIAKHFIAITARPQQAQAFGIAPENILPMWDWVGGRYSLWSTIGLPLACALGMHGFRELLAGARAMDEHFCSALPLQNLPTLLGLLSVWNTNFLGAQSQAIVPYDDRLNHLPAYLQQLEMESNGKRVDLDGRELDIHTAPVIWGGLGTDAQHAFFQLLHQGTRRIPVDFILPLTHARAPREHHDMLVANCIAQAEALMCGRAHEPAANAVLTDDAAHNLARHREQPGNRPSNLITMTALDARSFGALLAAYEHKTFVTGVIWRINSFDQWGVELGKQLAGNILDDIEAGAPGDHDPSTTQAIARYLAQQAPGAN